MRFDDLQRVNDVASLALSCKDALAQLLLVWPLVEADCRRCRRRGLAQSWLGPSSTTFSNVRIKIPSTNWSRSCARQVLSVNDLPSAEAAVCPSVPLAQFDCNGSCMCATGKAHAQTPPLTHPTVRRQHTYTQMSQQDTALDKLSNRLELLADDPSGHAFIRHCHLS